MISGQRSAVSGQHSLQELFIRCDPCTANGVEADDHKGREPIRSLAWCQLRGPRLNLPNLGPDFTLRAYTYDTILPLRSVIRGQPIFQLLLVVSSYQMTSQGPICPYSEVHVEIIIVPRTRRSKHFRDSHRSTDPSPFRPMQRCPSYHLLQ